MEISLFYNSVPKIIIICYTAPEIWCVRDVIIFHFGPFFALLPPSLPPPNSPKNQNFKKMKKMHGNIIILHKCTKNHDHMLYCSWNMACDRWHVTDVIIFHSGLFFTLLPPQQLKKNQNFEKMKQTPGGIITLHMCTKN